MYNCCFPYSNFPTVFAEGFSYQEQLCNLTTSVSNVDAQYKIILELLKELDKTIDNKIKEHLLDENICDIVNKIQARYEEPEQTIYFGVELPDCVAGHSVFNESLIIKKEC